MNEYSKVRIGPDVDQLRTEADILDAVRQPGVVELVECTVSDGVGELRTVYVSGPTLDGAGLPPQEIAAVAAGVAWTLADLHAAGVTHGAVEASHVIVGDHGPVLCGFGSASRDRAPVDDVVALGQLVLDFVPDGPVATVARRVIDTPGSAADVAAAFAHAAEAPVADVPPEHDRLSQLLRPEQRRRRPRLMLMLVGLLGVGLAGAAVTVLGGPATSAAPARVTRSTVGRVTASTGVLRVAAPPATRVWPETPPPTVVVGTQHFSVGESGDIAIAGPWGCGEGGPAAAALRPTTGEVYVFDTAATAGQDTVARQVATVVGATGLAVQDLDGDGCTELAVQRADLEPLAVRS